MNPKLKAVLLSQPVKFLKGGVVLKVFSFALNFLLVDIYKVELGLAYFTVLVFDLVLGYLINKYFVFLQSTKGHNETFKKFILAGIGFRGLNWLIYAILVKFYEKYYLAVQLLATVSVLVMKYFVYKKIFK